MFSPVSLDLAYVPGKIPTGSFLLTAGRSGSLTVFYSIHGLSQSCPSLQKIMIGLEVAFSGPSDPLLLDSSALSLGAEYSVSLRYVPQVIPVSLCVQVSVPEFRKLPLCIFRR